MASSEEAGRSHLPKYICVEMCRHDNFYSYEKNRNCALHKSRQCFNAELWCTSYVYCSILELTREI